MITEMMRAATRAQVGYMQSGKPTPPLEYVMHPEAFMALRAEAARNGTQLLQQRTNDGRFEFMNHVIREDSDEDGWRLKPVKMVRDLRWHNCTADDPFQPDMGKRAIHRDAEYIEDGIMECPHCGITFSTG